MAVGIERDEAAAKSGVGRRLRDHQAARRPIGVQAIHVRDIKGDLAAASGRRRGGLNRVA